MSERTDALYQGGFLLAALAVSAVIVVGGAARPRRARPRSSRCRRCAGSGASRTASTSGTGRCTSRSPTQRTGLDGFWLLAVRIAVSVALAALSFYALERPIRAGTFRLPKPQIVALTAVRALVAAGVRHHCRWR